MGDFDEIKLLRILPVGTTKLRKCPKCDKHTVQGIEEVMWRRNRLEKPDRVWYCPLCDSHWQPQLILGDINFPASPETSIGFYPSEPISPKDTRPLEVSQ